MPSISSSTSKTPWQRHVEKWKNCDSCSLCDTRKNVVLLRGSVPCDVLFIGEAPGASEDVLGKPFVGPAGHLLDQMVQNAMEEAGVNPKTAFTNLVGCIPIDEGKKAAEPDKASILACVDRVAEVVNLCKPKLIVRVGSLSHKWANKGIDQASPKWEFKTINVRHPAFILRADVTQRTLEIQKFVVTLTDALERMGK